MSLFHPPFVILEKSLLKGLVFFPEVQQFSLLESPLPAAMLTAILEYVTLNYIILQHKWQTADRLEVFLHLFKHSRKTFVVKNQHNKKIIWLQESDFFRDSLY